MSKKSELTSVIGMANRSAHSVATRFSVSLRGGWAPMRAVSRDDGAGSAALSSLPLAVVGSALRCINALGTMYSGRRGRSQSRAAASLGHPGSPTIYATNCCSPLGASRGTTAQPPTSGCSHRATTSCIDGYGRPLDGLHVVAIALPRYARFFRCEPAARANTAPMPRSSGHR
jgi:hypothetical protein